MFSGATSFNQDIGSWNVRNLVSVQGMFKGAKAYDDDGILKWNLEAWKNNLIRNADFDGAEQYVANMFMDADAWLASHKRVASGLLIADEGDTDYDVDYTAWSDYDHPHGRHTEYIPDSQHDLSFFGPPNAWVRISALGGEGSGGSDGSSGSDFPEWGIALAGVALALAAITSIFVLIQKLCCSRPKYQPSMMAYATQQQPQRVVSATPRTCSPRSCHLACSCVPISGSRRSW